MVLKTASKTDSNLLEKLSFTSGRLTPLSGILKRLFFAFLLIILLFKVVLILFPLQRDLVWDEHYYIKEAIAIQKTGRPILTEHPPLGKFLISLFHDLGGLTGARLLSACLGCLNALLVVAVTRRVTKGDNAGYLAGFIYLLDGYFFKESQLALLNPIVLSFILLSVLFLFGCSRRDWLLATVFWGFSLATKWFSVPLVALAFLRYRQDYRKILGFVMGGVLVYSLALLPLATTVPGGLVQYNLSLLNFHKVMGQQELQRPSFKQQTPSIRNWMMNEVKLREGMGFGWVERLEKPLDKRVSGSSMTQSWYLWPLGNSQLYGIAEGSATPRTVLANGAVANPFIWMASTIAAFISLFRRETRTLAILFFICWIPWGLSVRGLYSYTFLPALLLGIVCLGSELDRFSRKSRLNLALTISFLGLCLSYFLASIPLILGVMPLRGAI